jgi:hypothetical protein
MATAMKKTHILIPTVILLVAPFGLWLLATTDTMAIVTKIVLGLLTAGTALFALYDEEMGKRLSRTGTLSLIVLVLVWTVVDITADNRASNEDQLELTTDLLAIHSNLDALQLQYGQLEQQCPAGATLKPTLHQLRMDTQTQLHDNLDRLHDGIMRRRH